MDIRSSERAMVKIANHTPTSILRNVYNNENHDERSPSRIAAMSGVARHRVGASPGKNFWFLGLRIFSFSRLDLGFRKILICKTGWSFGRVPNVFSDTRRGDRSNFFE